MIPLLTELGNLLLIWFYKDFAPTALAAGRGAIHQPGVGRCRRTTPSWRDGMTIARHFNAGFYP
jgi:hypothetical protein